MNKSKKMPKEYAITVSLAIFFFLVTTVGIIRLVIVTKDRDYAIEIAKQNIIEQDTNIDISNINLNLVNYIEEKYDLNINYADDENASSVNAVKITDQNKIYDMLRQLMLALESYPESIVSEIEEKGYSVSIYLVDYFTNGIEALANRNTIGQFKIYIGYSTNIQRTFHHEYYHIMDYYIKLEKDENLAYKSWYKYNPVGFEYTQDVDSITGKYVYKGESGAYFVTPYAKFSEKEDRAETFAEMFTADENEIFFNEGENISSKMNIIRKVLKNTFNCIKTDSKLAW